MLSKNDPDSPAKTAVDPPAGHGVSDVADPLITPAMRDYLQAIYRLGRTGEPVTTQHLAECLSVSPSSVTGMAKRLDVSGLVRHARYHGVALTPAGELVALGAIRRRRLIERYLVETLGYASEEVHAEAQRLEHHVSDELAARFAAALGLPSVTSGGGPLVGAPGHPRRLAGFCGRSGSVTSTGETAAEER